MSLNVREGLRGLGIEVAGTDDLTLLGDRGLPRQHQHVAEAVAERDEVRREPVAVGRDALGGGGIEHGVS
jgi:hypothetical protein